MNPYLRKRLRSWLPRGIKAHTILRGPLRGMRLITSWHDYPSGILGRTEAPLLAWFAEHVRPGETWIDVGAHYGYTALALSRLVGSDGAVYAFEPIVATAGCLARTREMNQLRQLTVMPLALDDSPVLRSEWMTTKRGMARPNRPGREQGECLLVTAFDALWPVLSPARVPVHGIKIDAQGMEHAVVTGMADTLRCYRPKLVVELHTGVDRTAFLSLLREYRYSRPGVPVDASGRGGEYEDDASYAFFPDAVADEVAAV